jgi:hypothetical protein
MVMFPIHYVIMWDNQAVGIEFQNSGGFRPYKTDNPNLAKFWFNKSEAEKYMSYWYDKTWRLIPIEFRIKE